MDYVKEQLKDAENSKELVNWFNLIIKLNNGGFYTTGEYDKLIIEKLDELKTDLDYKNYLAEYLSYNDIYIKGLDARELSDVDKYLLDTYSNLLNINQYLDTYIISFDEFMDNMLEQLGISSEYRWLINEDALIDITEDYNEWYYLGYTIGVILDNNYYNDDLY